MSDTLPTLAEEKLREVLGVFEEELASEAIAIGRLTGCGVLEPRHVCKAVVNLLHHHRVGPLLKELLNECDWEGELDEWGDEDWDLDDEPQATGGTDGAKPSEANRVVAAVAVHQSGACDAGNSRAADEQDVPQEPAAAEGTAADSRVLLREVHEVAPGPALARRQLILRCVWCWLLGAVMGHTLRGVLFGGGVPYLVCAIVFLALMGAIHRRAWP